LAQLSSGTDFNYIWTKPFNSDVVGNKPDGDGWDVKRYEEGQGIVVDVNGEKNLFKKESNYHFY
jgi:hypothetical protein